MKVTVLVGGVGGARFLLGVKAALGLPAVGPGPDEPEHDVTAVVNVGDDVWMHGLRITPDLDSCLYTLGGGIDPERAKTLAAGAVILSEVQALLGVPMEVARGGLREGLAGELLSQMLTRAA